jgi:hypothetical protein
VAELPGLVLALVDRYGPIRQLMVNSDTWQERFSRLAVDTRVVRMGWFASLDPALLIAIPDSGSQIDLLVVPPRTEAAPAEQAMTTAADPTNTRRAPHILAAMSTTAADPGDAGHENAGGTTRSAAPSP